MRVLVLLLLAGCGKNPAVQFVDELADAVCACKDRACIDAAAAKGAERLQAEFKDAKGTESDKKAIEGAVARMQRCKEGMP